MNRTEQRIGVLLGDILNACHAISAETKADCFFAYSPHVNGVRVWLCEFGWTPWTKGETFELYDMTANDLAELKKRLWEVYARLTGGVK